jgi:hypothetical protein
MSKVNEEVVTQIAAELMNRNHYSRDNVAAAYRAYRGDVNAAIDSLGLPVIEDDE